MLSLEIIYICMYVLVIIIYICMYVLAIIHLIINLKMCTPSQVEHCVFVQQLIVFVQH